MLLFLTCLETLLAWFLLGQFHGSSASETTATVTYEIVKTLNGAKMCATSMFNLRSKTRHIQAGVLDCPINCLALDGGCAAYNFNEIDGMCDFYTSMPKRYSNVTGCSGFSRKGKYSPLWRFSFAFGFLFRAYYNKNAAHRLHVGQGEALRTGDISI